MIFLEVYRTLLIDQISENIPSGLRSCNIHDERLLKPHPKGFAPQSLLTNFGRKSFWRNLHFSNHDILNFLCIFDVRYFSTIMVKDFDKKWLNVFRCTSYIFDKGHFDVDFMCMIKYYFYKCF